VIVRSPIMIRSPGLRMRAPSTFSPLTKVPFVEPVSTTQSPPARASKRAWCPDTNVSRSSRISFPAARPNDTGAESTAITRPSASTELERTTSRGRGCSRRSSAMSAGERMTLSCAPPAGCPARRSRPALATIRQMKT
jgi:hypothetical protein